MAFLLDTDVAVHLRDGDPTTMDRAEALGSPVALSIVGRVELENGVYRDSARVEERRMSLGLLLSRFIILPFGDAEFEAYQAILRAVGHSKRKVIDRMIAATALTHDLTLVTMNGTDYADIPGLALEVWPSPATPRPPSATPR